MPSSARTLKTIFLRRNVCCTSPIKMTSYFYELPTTGAIAFAEFCTDVTATYIADIADATETRASLRSALKENKRTDLGEKDNLKLVKVSMCRASHIRGGYKLPPPPPIATFAGPACPYA